MEKIQTKKRISRYKRTSNAPKMYLTERDKKIVLAVYKHRFLRRDQIERLFFTRTSTCNQRLMRLYQHGYLERVFKPVSFGSSQAVYALDKIGADLVDQMLGVSRNKVTWKRKNNRVELLFLDHKLAITEFYVLLQLSSKQNTNTKLLFWRNESKELNSRVRDPEGKRKYLTVAPDAFFGLQTPEGKSYFFLEVDMGTMTLTRFASKIKAYRQYWKTGNYQENFGFKNFRVLTVASSERRTRNLKEATYRIGGKNMFLFATFASIKRLTPLGQIWSSPIQTSYLNLFR